MHGADLLLHGAPFVLVRYGFEQHLLLVHQLAELCHHAFHTLGGNAVVSVVSPVVALPYKELVPLGHLHHAVAVQAVVQLGNTHAVFPVVGPQVGHRYDLVRPVRSILQIDAGRNSLRLTGTSIEGGIFGCRNRPCQKQFSTIKGDVFSGNRSCFRKRTSRAARQAFKLHKSRGFFNRRGSRIVQNTEDFSGIHAATSFSGAKPMNDNTRDK